ncbi:Lrp/AsnC family transcriptional regulator [Paenisporosarcina sp. TG20]|uniref:Lrp/AsnC family transcriptional regulator n=1 Tax=Paenisporosarcina sp. TG20 TaxID=1211706 RepID=UPI00036DD4A1|nr:Lrp/AsnC family transcriptional regulator [Paenisporosarcina sp. TG20]
MGFSLDGIDIRIIKILAKNGRAPFTEIAADLKVTEKTVRTHYKQLIEKEIITITGVVNPLSIGLNALAIVWLKVELNRLDEVIENIKRMKEVRFVSVVTGKYQLIIQVNVSTQEDLKESFQRLNKIGGIYEVNSMIQLEVLKDTFEYFLK